MNHSISGYYAGALQEEIRRRVAARRIPDQWHPVPPGTLADRMGKSLVSLGIRLMSDQQTAHAIERQLGSRAA
jgi:hypothetical protein